MRGWISALLLLVGSLMWLPALSQDAGLLAERPVAVVATWKGAIGPASARYLETAIERAQQERAAVLVFQLDTPGGLATSMRDMISDILASPIPIIGYVAPPGAHAASAGTYMLYAMSVAAMAPGTNLGAATPVQIGGGGLPGLPSPDDGDSGDKDDGSEEGEEAEPAQKGQPENAMASKAVNDAVAFIRSLAELHGRNADWAEKAVREAASLSADRALEADVIDIVAGDIPSLLKQIDGREVIVAGGRRVLETSGLSIVRVEPTTLTKVLNVLANPNVALLLMLVGVYGLIFEFANPGTLGPGIIGAICLVLGLYALNQLPLDYAGFALLMLGLAFMITEAFTPTFGVLGIGGLIAFVIGATMLVDTDVPAFQLSWTVIMGTAIMSGAVLTLLLGYMWRSQRRPVATGAGELIGARAEVLDWSGDEGHVWVHGERWQAEGPSSLTAGAEVEVREIAGLTLHVREIHPADGTKRPAAK